MKILVVAAHPDDEVLGCGGTITRRSREGYEIAIAILGEGVTSRYGRSPAVIGVRHISIATQIFLKPCTRRNGRHSVS
jgi:LmbE family N-acetylglucosaminyl deacetylase